MKTAIVIGGGISGIAAATRLAERGVAVRLFEAGSGLGGRIGTRQHGSIEVELGGRNFSAQDTSLIALLAAYGHTKLSSYGFNSIHAGPGPHLDMRFGGSRLTRARRWMNNLVAVEPLGLRRFDKLAAGARAVNAGTIGEPYWVGVAERHEDPTAGAYFGRRVSEELLRPWTLRMMGSEPDEVYLGNLGPFLGRRPGSMRRLDGGWGEFWRSVAAKLDVHVNHTADRLLTSNGRLSGVRITHDGRTFDERADHVVLTTPASVTADLLATDFDALAAALRQVVYRPVATVVAEYGSVELPGGVGGLFLPKAHAASHIAKYDDANRVRYSFAGVAARRIFDGASTEALVESAEKSLARFGGRVGQRVSAIGQVWRPGLCGHSWKHHLTVDEIRKRAAGVGGLILAGDYFRGTLMEACTIAARENVDRALGVA
jgi:protoporphyrinogen oxidase